MLNDRDVNISDDGDDDRFFYT